jgi:hypothetical protein
VSVPFTDACRYAVLIFTGVDLPGGTPIEFGWSAAYTPGVFDSFDRTSPADGSQSLGRSTFGDHPWTSNAGGHSYADGSHAVLETSAGDPIASNQATQWWETGDLPAPPWSSDHFTVETRFNVSSLADGATNSDRLGVDLFSDDFANWRGVFVDLVDAPQLGRPRALGVVANWSTGGWATIPLDEFEADTDYILKWEVEIGVLMRAKLWRADGPEPDWQVSIADPGNATFAGTNTEIALVSNMQTGIDQTKRFEYLDVRDVGE